MKLPGLLLLDELLHQLRLVLRRVRRRRRDLVHWDHIGALVPALPGPIALQIDLQPAVEAVDGDHVDVGHEGVVGLASGLGHVAQQVLRVGEGGAPLEHVGGAGLKERRESESRDVKLRGKEICFVKTSEYVLEICVMKNNDPQREDFKHRSFVRLYVCLLNFFKD